MVSASPDAIASYSLDQTIIGWKRGAEKVLGYAASEAIGRPLRMLWPDGKEVAGALVARTAAAQLVDAHATRLRHKDGRALDVSLAAARVSDGNGRVTAGTPIAREAGAGGG